MKAEKIKDVFGQSAGLFARRKGMKKILLEPVFYAGNIIFRINDLKSKKHFNNGHAFMQRVIILQFRSICRSDKFFIEDIVDGPFDFQ